MVVDRGAGGLQPYGLLGLEHAQGDADLQVQGGHRGDDLQHLLEGLAVAHFAPGGAHAVAGGTVGLGGAGAFQHARLLLERLHLQAGVVAGRLGTVGAVLGAGPGLDGIQGAELDLLGVPVGPVHLGGPEQEIGNGLIMDRPDFGGGRHGNPLVLKVPAYHGTGFIPGPAFAGAAPRWGPGPGTGGRAPADPRCRPSPGCWRGTTGRWRGRRCRPAP